MASNPPSSSASSDLDQHIPGAFPSAAVSSSTPQSLNQAVHNRRDEYVRSKRIRIKVGTWNVAAFKGTEKDVGGWFVHGRGVEEALAGLDVTDPNQPHDKPIPAEPEHVKEKETVEEQERRRSSNASTLPENDAPSLPGGDEIGIYALGLQEVVDINSATEALRPYSDPATAAKFRAAMESAMPKGYRLVAEQQLIGLLLLVYASPSVAPEVRSVSTTSVGTGLMGYMGNKGAVTARLVLGETTRLVFINSHLAAGADKTALERRNWDANQILTRTKFDPIVDSSGVAQANGESIAEADFAFWFGDLNYRLEGMPGDDVRRILMLHTRNEYDLSQRTAGLIEKDIATSGRRSSETTDRTSGPSSFCNDDSSSLADPSTFDDNDAEELPAEFDPASLQTTLASLLPHDELRQQQRKGKAFADWREGDVEFLPTYKYDVGTVGVFDSSEKRRCPSWCDRILYRTRRDRLAHENKIKEAEDSKKRDEDMKKRGLESTSEEVLFEYDPATDGDENYDEARDSREDPIPVETKEGFDDELQLEYYTAHQRVLSSDHKPLDAVFILKYDSVVPELKAQVHQEVARELDRAENEGRPGVTLIVDKEFNKRESSDDSKYEGVNFGKVKFLEAKRRMVTIANTGPVAANISFFGQPGAEQGEVKPPSWLSVRFDRDPDKTTEASIPASYTLEPGDACNIELILKVDDTKFVQGLNEGTAQLEDILVLRVSEGRDHFLPVRASWLQSSFGRSIDKLIRIPEGGIRKLQGQRPTGDSSPVSGKDAGVKWSAPRELFRLTEALEDLVERVVAEWDMTEHPDGAAPPWEVTGGNSANGWPFSPDTWKLKEDKARESIKCDIADALDADLAIETGTAFQPDTPMLLRLECLAEMLLLFLNSLTDGVVTEEQWAQLEAGYEDQTRTRRTLNREEERAWVLEVMAGAPNHNVCFVLLTSMGARVAGEVKQAMKPVKAGAAAGNRLSRTFSMGRARSASEVQRAQTEAQRRQAVERGIAGSLAEAMVRVPVAVGRERERMVRRQRASRLVEVFVGEGETAL
ncbi:uncharacterized protein K452DRAFT_225809 [Aplosporella prunicola CBS 121167]|uniref:Inositol polyphosphate-related phosphatase domain-containing protein n=1 Tax=Aplosporella prunicola CBS 121167 TaxID=1176127 RepID=A0A6A6BI01_9PEZI|nr:uncharacterized protein K452DRAFT_225809 [Aplosporella prunicola CBS 121167]KAF2142884.1 hypothetical protein K452DRAFT_225809 [Aplosporella prunicola CBS 121167]